MEENDELNNEVDGKMMENCGSESDRLETQSGDCAIDDENDTPIKLDDLPLTDSLRRRDKDESPACSLSNLSGSNFTTIKVDSMPLGSPS